MLTRVEYFINAQGNAFAVIFKRPRTFGTSVREDLRDYDHVRLCPAAELAIEQGNVKLLASLLAAGLKIDEIVDAEEGRTALHYSAAMNQPEMVKFLLEKGAQHELRDFHGDRAIDTAYGSKEWELCELLRLPPSEEKLEGGYPVPMLDELFSSFGPEPYEELAFLDVQVIDPEGVLVKRLQKLYPKSKHRSRAHSPVGSFLDRDTGEPGLVVELNVEKVKDKEGEYAWRLRKASGEFLSGGGSKGLISKKYGYWIVHDVQGWDE